MKILRVAVVLCLLAATFYGFATESNAEESTKQPEILIGEWVQDSPRMWHKEVTSDAMPVVKVTLVLVDIYTTIDDEHVGRELRVHNTQQKVVVETVCENDASRKESLVWYVGNQEGDLISCVGETQRILIGPMQGIVGSIPVKTET